MIGYLKAIRKKSKAKKQAEYAEWLSALKNEMALEIENMLKHDSECKPLRIPKGTREYISMKIVEEVVGKRL